MEGAGFTLFFREGCSLCEAMLDELEPYRRRPGFELELVDVDTSPELMNQYGAYVPVLVGPEGEICHYFLEPDALERSLPAG
jgi:hypothetical protein